MLAFLKYLPFLAKLGAVGKWFGALGGLLPGGQIGLIISAIFGAIAKFIGWVVEDIVDVFTKPKRAALLLVVACAGAWFAADYYRDKIGDLKEEIAETRKQLKDATDENQGWRTRHADEEKRAAAAQDARADEIKRAAEQAAVEAAARKRAADARRVREQQSSTGAKTGPEKAPDSSVFSVQGLPWFSK